ncbi:MAG TPA: S8 family serine peptidase, partial [Tepidisphaeraceae bacterium]|nr:S8 family serine peptidase [Tepidisphaeraceae bacterium]
MNGDPWGQVGQLIGQDDLETSYPSINGTGQVVVVIDTGVDYTHDVFGNGFGTDFQVIDGYDFVDNDADPMDTSPNGHGTSVAGVVAGAPFVSGGFKYQGIAPETKIIALRIAENTESVPIDRLQSALQWVIDHRLEYTIAAVNISFGFGLFDADYTEEVLGESLRILATEEIPVICSSGNDGTSDGFGIDYPGAHPDVISVGAVDATDTITEYTQRSSNLDLLAPGSDVRAPYIENGFAIVSGTSFAAPAVAGTIALMKQVDPGLRLADVHSILRSSSERNKDGDQEFGTTTGLTFARLDAYRAVKTTELRKAAPAEEAALVGKYAQENNIQVDDDGVWHLLYFDSVTEQMKYATRSSIGQWSARSIVDETERDQGTYLSMQIDSFGSPRIAYFDAVRGDLRYASFDGAAWSLTTIDALGSVGLYPSLVIDSTDKPSIAYYHRNK